MRVLNYGSINVDHVYTVDHISNPGETVAALDYQVFAGGKGANQSAALARAGALVCHGGRVGLQGAWVVDKLAALGADVRFVGIHDEPTGHALIQVDRHGQNSIVLFPGANMRQAPEAMATALSHFREGDILLLQNEINELSYLIEQGSARGLRVFYNPAPAASWVRHLPLHAVDTVVLNQTEAAALTNADGALAQLDVASRTWKDVDWVLTLGAEGVAYSGRSGSFTLPALAAEAVDTTGAGDTFIGYYVASVAAGARPYEAAMRAIRAAAVCVTRRGAMDSIPAASELA